MAISAKTVSLLFLVAICAGSLLLVAPVTGNNIGRPNMIHYFNADAGGQMDLIWYYYSGQRRASFAWDYDYGLELRYIADASRLIPARFVNFTPGAFVFILRWLHLAAWIGALIMLWRIVMRHFGGAWQAVLCAALLATRQTLVSFPNDLKPEPLVLLLVLIGLDYTLRIVDEPCAKNIIFAVAMAALAFVIKYAGIFLIPAVAVAMYFGALYRPAARNTLFFREVNWAWLLPLFTGIALILLECGAILFYVRKSTGNTWYHDLGFWGSITHNAQMKHLFFASLLLILSAFALFGMGRMMRGVKRAASYLMTAGLLFTVFLLIFGFRWVIAPRYFITTYSQIPSAVSGYNQGFVAAITNFSPIIAGFVLFYILMESIFWPKSMGADAQRLRKRLVLASFLVLPAIYMSTGMRMAPHHMLPFFAAGTILSVEGIDIFYKNFGLEAKRNVIGAVMLFLLVAYIAYSAVTTISAGMKEFRQKDDAAFEMADWLKANIPPDASIVTDKYTCVYVPEEYRNIHSVTTLGEERTKQFRGLVREFRPDYLYYNCGGMEPAAMPDIQGLLPGRPARLIKSIDSKGRRYVRKSGDKFVVYKYEK